MIIGLRNVSFHIIDRINPRLPHQPSTPVSALGHSALVPVSETIAAYDLEPIDLMMICEY